MTSISGCDEIVHYYALMSSIASEVSERTEHTVGARVREFRALRLWTLDELAAQSGVSRRAIVNIEQDAVNPTIGVLLRLAAAFGVSLSAVVSTPARGIAHTVRPTVLWRGDAGGTGTLHGSTDAPTVMELWTWVMYPGEAHISEAHTLGTHEILHVTEGALVMDVDGISHPLGAGDTLSFPSDVPHAYIAAGTAPTTFTLSVLQPGVTP